MDRRSILREYYIAIKSKIKIARFDSAISSIDKLLYNCPNDEWGYYYKGVCEFALEKYQLAMKYFAIAIQINPAFGKAYFNLGICFYLSRKLDLALINFAKALVIFTKQRELDKKRRCIDAIKMVEAVRRSK